MAVVETLRAAAVEGDGADQRVRIEQSIDRVRAFRADRRIRARLTLPRLADIPQADPVGFDKGQPFGVTRRGDRIEQGEDDRPEQVAGMGVVFAAAQRLFARQGSEHQNARPMIHDRREAALDRGSRQDAIDPGLAHSA